MKPQTFFSCSDPSHLTRVAGVGTEMKQELCAAVKFLLLVRKTDYKGI